MKCEACKFDDENARDEDGFLQLGVEKSGVCGGGTASVMASFPQHEGPCVHESVLLFACPKCGTVRIDSWRLKG